MPVKLFCGSTVALSRGYFDPLATHAPIPSPCARCAATAGSATVSVFLPLWQIVTYVCSAATDDTIAITARTTTKNSAKGKRFVWATPCG
jgi:bacterioferritin-associated ferredoxin